MKKTQATFSTVVMALAVALFGVLTVPARAEIVTNARSVQAEGTGQMWTYGQGEVQFSLAESGRLIVRHTDENEVTYSGDLSTVIAGTTMTFTGANGNVTVRGESIAAFYEGGGARLLAYGDILMTLAGQGTYMIGGSDSAAWDDYGTTVAMGNPVVADEDQVWGEAAQYEAETAAAVNEIQTAPVYREWADVYPAAAIELVRTRDYYSWCSAYPVAVKALYSSSGWSLWLSVHPRLFAFIGFNNEFVVWCTAHPAFQPYFRHPVFYASFVHAHPQALRNVPANLSYQDWSRAHRREALVLEKHEVIQRALIGSNPAKSAVSNVRRFFESRMPDRIDKDTARKAAANLHRVDKETLKTMNEQTREKHSAAPGKPVTARPVAPSNMQTSGAQHQPQLSPVSKSRSNKPDTAQDRKADKADRTGKADQADKVDKAGKVDKADEAGKTGKADKPDKTGKNQQSTLARPAASAAQTTVRRAESEQPKAQAVRPQPQQPKAQAARSQSEQPKAQAARPQSEQPKAQAARPQPQPSKAQAARPQSGQSKAPGIERSSKR